MTMRRTRIQLTTAADGTVTGYSARISGRIHSLHYIKTDFADGVDFTVTAEATGESIWAESNVNAAAVRYPRAPVHSQAGVASLYAAGGTAVQDKIALANDRVVVAIAQGGNAKTGAVIVLFDN
jgi:hypothetical protein